MLHFITFSVLLFLVILVVSSIAFWLSMRQVIRNNKADELLRLLELERHKLETQVDNDIKIVLNMASSPVIQQHFLDPSDSNAAEIALADIENYGKIFTSASIFWVKDADKKFFLDGKDACQFLPGPASSQLGMVLGLSRAGFVGALAAWCGFTLPSAILMILFALGISHGIPLPDGVLHGLKIVAVAVVAQAVWGMAEKLCADAKRATIMGAVTCFVLWFPNAWSQIVAIFAAAVVGAMLFRPKDVTEQNS